MNIREFPVTMPIFPLPVVAFPGQFVPLHIFEERYKAMTEDVLGGDGTFGVVYCDEGGLARVGCAVRIVAVQPLEGGRMNIATQGEFRFDLESVRGGRPYKQGRVRPLGEYPLRGESFYLAKTIGDVLSDIDNYHFRLYDTLPLDQRQEPDDPVALSYWIPPRFCDSLARQQQMLEIDEVDIRLQAELSFLDLARRRLAAQLAIRTAFL